MIVGFKDEAALVRRAARELSCAYRFAEDSEYRAGEVKVKGPARAPSYTIVASNVGECPRSFFRLLLLAASLRESGARRITLMAPWIAYGRQDRAAHPGEAPAGRVLARSLSEVFDRIVTLDAHSPAFVQAFKGRLRNVLPAARSVKESFVSKIDMLAAPDKGARDRAKRVAKALDKPCFAVSKERIDGRVESRLPAGIRLKGLNVLLIDDMADSGGTLKAAAIEMKKAGAASVSAFVTHAFDIKSLRRKLKPAISRVASSFDHASGKILSRDLADLIKAAR